MVAAAADARRMRAAGLCAACEWQSYAWHASDVRARWCARATGESVVDSCIGAWT